jgi:hypothetical protein
VRAIPAAICSYALTLALTAQAARGQDAAAARVEATRAVVQAVVVAGRHNSQLPIRLAGTGRSDKTRRFDDELTSYLVRVAAGAARQQPQELRGVAFLAGVAIAIDTSELMREQPFTGRFVRAVESDAERNSRLSVLGLPTLRSRHDLAQHFFVSAQLTALAGAALAETAGIAKELRDAQGDSGFSFTDLCADLAGVAFAERVLQGELSLADLSASFRVSDHLPDLAGLRDGIGHADFIREFGSAADPRFQKMMAEIRGRIVKLAQP